MSSSSEERSGRGQHDEGQGDEGMGVGDEDLPEDLVPGEDNPLAYPLDDDVSREELGMGTPGPVPDGGDDGDLED